jgi:hypothetical protein
MTEDGFDLEECIQLLRRTPSVLRALLGGLPEGWLFANEGPETWSAFDVLGHLIHGEKTDWIPRARQILSEDSSAPFAPFDRFAQLRESEGKGIGDLLQEFEELRGLNLGSLQDLGIGADELDRQGTHPEFGIVTLRGLLSTWLAHDLTHLAQIARVMAKRLRNQVGPWREYLPLLDL